jgi:hypothetical protein
VTPNRLYKIDTNPLGFQTKIVNTGGGQWYGASGKNEAIDFEVQTFETLADAQSNQNPLPDLWVNTIAGGQTVYVTIRNKLTNQIITLPAHIVVNVAPTYTNPLQISHCETDPQASDFDIRTEAAIVGSQTNLTVTFHDSLADSVNSVNPLPNQVTVAGNQKTVFVRVTNNLTGCYAHFDFSLSVNPNPVYHDPADMLVCYSTQTAPEPVSFEQQLAIIRGNQTNVSVSFTLRIWMRLTQPMHCRIHIKRQPCTRKFSSASKTLRAIVLKRAVFGWIWSMITRVFYLTISLVLKSDL